MTYTDIHSWEWAVVEMSRVGDGKVDLGFEDVVESLELFEILWLLSKELGNDARQTEIVHSPMKIMNIARVEG